MFENNQSLLQQEGRSQQERFGHLAQHIDSYEYTWSFHLGSEINTTNIALAMELSLSIVQIYGKVAIVKIFMIIISSKIHIYF